MTEKLIAEGIHPIGFGRVRCGCSTSWISDTPSPSALNGTDQREVPIEGVTKWHNLKPNEGPRDNEGWWTNVGGVVE